MTFPAITQETLEVRMSRSSPGRYALHEFAKNVYKFEAFDGQGKPLRPTRPDPHQWDIRGHDGTVKVKYTLFANHADGTYSGIDLHHAHLNIPATFAWARGLEERAITVRFHKPEGYRIATQLAPEAEEDTFSAPNLQYFMDSPVEISEHTVTEWKVSSNGKTQTIKLAVHHGGTEAEVDTYAAMARAVVHEEIEIFGELPTFDFGEYVFIADYLSHVHGDGMEHRNSTILTGTRPLRTDATGNLGALTHEFFHAWNVERLRPRALDAFDFERANMCGELWFAEGFTSYYTTLVMRRARLISLEDAAGRFGRTVNRVLTAPGRKIHSAVEMSLQAPFVDAATFVDPVNHRNTFISYYTHGAALGLGLDLSLRQRFPGASLDVYMQRLWQRFGRKEIPYDAADLEATLAAVSSRAFAHEFFARHVNGLEPMDYEALLAQAGLLLRDRNDGRASLGDARIRYTDDGAFLRDMPLQRTPYFEAGLTTGDRVVQVCCQEIQTAKDMEKALEDHGVGTAVPIVYERQGTERTVSTTLARSPSYEIVPYEHVSLEVTGSMRDVRTAWLGPKSVEALRLKKTCPSCRRSFPFEQSYCGFDGAELTLFVE